MKIERSPSLVRSKICTPMAKTRLLRRFVNKWMRLLRKENADGLVTMNPPNGPLAISDNVNLDFKFFEIGSKHSFIPSLERL
jgi:hypothetical protein